MVTPEDSQKAENKSETSTIVAESILRRQKLKAAAGRLSVRGHIFSDRERHSRVFRRRPSSSLYVVCIVERR
jgi:hypothetical protein